MKKNRWHLSEWIVGICILSYVITIYIYSNLHLDRTDVVIVFSIVTGLISSVWLYRTYRVVSNKQKYVWLLFSLAITSQILSNIIWLLVRTFTKTTQYPIVSSFFWVLSFPLFLYALYYLLKLINNAMIRKGFFFNTVIFICVATTISLHYLITPIIMVSSSSFILALNLVYPISDLGIMLFIVGLFFLSSYTNAKNIIRMITTAFFIHIVADSIYAYLLSEGESIPGGTADLLWIVAVLLLGLTGYKVTEKGDIDLKITKQIEVEDNKLPYVVALFLLLLVLTTYQGYFNILTIGLHITFLFIVVKQFMIMGSNRKLVSEYQYLAYRDPLTGLYNRASFIKDLEELFCNKSGNDRFAVFLIDLDRFKNINDTLGHNFGDQLLMQVSARMSGAIKEPAKIYRTGGDEFVFIVPENPQQTYQDIANSILQQFERPFLIENRTIFITPSIGGSLYPENGKDAEVLVKHADAAMYFAKSGGRNSIQFYNAKLNEAISRKVMIELEMRSALEKNQFEIYYQPKVELSTRNIVGMEALLRWKHPELGFISPEEFIPIAEDSGQIITIGEWTLREACKQNKSWASKGLIVSVNVSVRQFQQCDFVQIVADILQKTNLQPKFLELEITESVIQNLDESVSLLKKLRKLGVKLSIDDFGTGYSSLSVLKRLPIDTLKIDKAFIDDISDSVNKSMLKSIIDIGLNMNLRVIAEGIETEEQLTVLKDFHCTYGQGFLFSKPLPRNEIDQII